MIWFKPRKDSFDVAVYFNNGKVLSDIILMDIELNKNRLSNILIVNGVKFSRYKL